MAKTLHSLFDFTGGELSPKVDARIDLPAYAKGLRQSLNVISYKTGGFTRAVGTQMIAPTKLANSTGHNYTAISVSFVFSPETTFDLEFGNHYIRFYSNGVQAFLSTAPIWVSLKFYQAGNYVTDSSNGLIYLRLSNGSSASPPHVDTTDWIQQAILEVPNTPYNADAGSAGPQPGSVFDVDIRFLQFEQINDVIYITHPDYPPYKLSRFGDTDWIFEQVNFLTPALLDQNATDIAITASATQGNGIGLTATAPAWAAATYYTLGNSVTSGGLIYNCVVPNVSSGAFATDLSAGFWQLVNVFIEGMEGATWQLAYLNNASYLEYDGVAATGFANGTSGTIQVIGGWEVHTYGVWSSDITVQQSVDNGRTWTAVEVITSRSDANYDITGTAVTLSLYRFVVSNSVALISPGATNPRVVFTIDNAFIDGLVLIDSVITAYTAEANVVTQLLNTGPTTYWSEAAWSNYRGFPAAVTSYQQRMVYGGSGFEPQRIWGTVTDDLENFALGDQSLATDSFAFDLNASARGPIVWLKAQSDLFTGFAGAEWIVNSGSTNATGQSSGAAVTATSVNAFESSSWGSAQGVVPKIVGDVLMFTQRQATSLRKILFDVYAEKYLTTDLTELSDHLFASGIVQIAYQSRWRKQSMVWAVTQDGRLLGMTYELDKQITGWMRRQTGAGATDANGNPTTPDNGFESVSVLPGKGLDDDEVWCVVNRLIGGQQARFMERVNPNNWEETFTGAPTPPAPYLPDAFYVDCGITVMNPGTLTLPSVAYLNGRFVVGLADGYAFGPVPVVGGNVTLPSYIPVTVTKVQIGLPIPYAGQPMRLDADPQLGNTQGKVKQFDSEFYVRVLNSLGGSIGNGTIQYPTWTANFAYLPPAVVISPSTKLAYQCLSAVNGTVDPAQDATHWAQTEIPVYMPPVPIDYTPKNGNPFSAAVLAVKPTDKLVPPQLMPSPDHDPVIIVQGSGDALPLTVLALIAQPSIA